LAIINRLETRNWGGLAAALLLGTKDGLESGESELYVLAGCAHVLALSGMHLAVISALISLVLKRILGLRKSAIMGVVMVAAYVYLAGSQASLVRAGLMYAIAACAVLGGFPRRVLLILAFAFLIQLTLDPQAARSLSFILSYLALAGIAILSPALDDLLRGILPSIIRSPISASIGAFLATAAVSAAFFGVLRPIGLLAGMILAPAATVVMVGGLAWLVLDTLWTPLGFIVDKGLELVSFLTHELVTISARVPGMPIGSAILVTWVSLAACALLLYLQSYRNMTRNRLEPFA
jgi:competence protein ComEC